MQVSTKPTFSELCDLALLRHADIVREAGLSAPTVTRLFRGEPVQRHSLLLALRVINRELNSNYTAESVDAPVFKRD